jgi:hypothetical protein
MNHELHEIYQNPDLARIVNSRRLRWGGHAARMEQNGYPKRKRWIRKSAGKGKEKIKRLRERKCSEN